MTAPGTSVTVRAAREEDIPRIHELLEATGLEADVVVAQFHVAADEEGIVACARLRPLADGTHELASVAVDPDHQGRGIGRRLVEGLQRTGPPSLVGLALQPGFFERLGFAVLDEVPEALRDRAEGACACQSFRPIGWQRSEADPHGVAF